MVLKNLVSRIPSNNFLKLCVSLMSLEFKQEPLVPLMFLDPDLLDPWTFSEAVERRLFLKNI